jgi:hypothetical protein
MFHRHRGIRAHTFLAAALAGLGLLVIGSGPVPQVQTGAAPAAAAQAEGGKKGDKAVKKFVRIKKDDAGNPVAFQTATAHYTKGNVQIDLVGVVHIGEKKYYENYNNLFKGYEVVLYEAFLGPVPAKVNPVDALDPLNMMYGQLAKTMKVTEQMKTIDYSAPNFIHADLNVKDFPEVLNKKGDNMLSLTLTIVADMIREHNIAEAKAKKEGKKTEKLNAFALLQNPQAEYRLRLGMAKEIIESTSLGAGPTVDWLMLDERNEACLKVLKQQLAAGKKKIAIFYGALHLPDFEQRLLKEHDMQLQGVDWYTAWEITAPKKE